MAGQSWHDDGTFNDDHAMITSCFVTILTNILPKCHDHVLVSTKFQSYTIPYHGRHIWLWLWTRLPPMSTERNFQLSSSENSNSDHHLFFSGHLPDGVFNVRTSFQSRPSLIALGTKASSITKFPVFVQTYSSSHPDSG